jgi:hypothetical protein
LVPGEAAQCAVCRPPSRGGVELSINHLVLRLLQGDRACHGTVTAGDHDVARLPALRPLLAVDVLAAPTQKPSRRPRGRSLQFAILAAMNTNDLQLLETVGAESKVAAGQVLIEHGQHGSGLYVILEGTVIVEAPEGTRELGPGAVIGERALLSNDGTRTARVRATSDVRVLAIDRVEVERLCADDAGFAERLTAEAS